MDAAPRVIGDEKAFGAANCELLTKRPVLFHVVVKFPPDVDSIVNGPKIIFCSVTVPAMESGPLGGIVTNPVILPETGTLARMPPETLPPSVRPVEEPRRSVAFASIVGTGRPRPASDIDETLALLVSV